MLEATRDIIVAMINNGRLTSVEEVNQAIEEIFKTINKSKHNY